MGAYSHYTIEVLDKDTQVLGPTELPDWETGRVRLVRQSMKISRPSRNVVAKDLRTSKYRTRRLKNKTKYTRKVKHLATYKQEKESGYDY